LKNEEIFAELGINTIYKGNLTFDKRLKIKGKYYGSVLSGGTLFIEEGAYFEGDINVKNAVVAGCVIGDITSSEKIDVLSNSVIKGNLVAPTIRIADGVQIEGRCQMILDSDTVDIFSTSVNQLKKTVTIVS